MSYQDKLQRIKQYLITFVKEQITRRYNYNNEFFIWSYSAIKDAYVSKFKEEFSEYITEQIQDKLWFAGYNIAFAVQTYIQTHPRYTLKKLINFVELFTKNQLDEFDNWCCELEMSLPDEGDDIENPS